MNSFIKRHSQQWYGWLLVAPFALTLALFFVVALMRTVGYSFAEYNLFTDASWVGLRNYYTLFSDPLFLRALSNTIAFSIIVTLIQTILALTLAILVNGNIRGKGTFRTIFYIPSIMSSAAVTLIFVWFYQKNGFLNAFVSSFNNYVAVIFIAAMLFFATLSVVFLLAKMRNIRQGFFDPLAAWVAFALALLIASLLTKFGVIEPNNTRIEITWLGTSEMIGPLPLTMWAIVIQNVFTTVPTLMLLFLAGLQGIPQDLYEAARIDGANRFKQHIHITVPQLTPVTFVVITMGIIGTLQMFDQVALLGDGVPQSSRITLAYYVYTNAFPDGSSPNIGLASAAALILGVLTIALVIIQKRFGVKEH